MTKITKIVSIAALLATGVAACTPESPRGLSDSLEVYGPGSSGKVESTVRIRMPSACVSDARIELDGDGVYPISYVYCKDVRGRDLACVPLGVSYACYTLVK